MPEGDTIHRLARRLQGALANRPIELAETPDPRSPVNGRAGELAGRTLARAEARGKHLLLHFSGELVVHSHLGMNGRWRVSGDGRLPLGRPWLLLAAGPAVASQSGGKLLRLVSESRARSDPGLLQLGPDPLGTGFDLSAAARRLRAAGAGMELGEALLDQRIVAGIGNAIRNEACFVTGISPWRPVAELEADEAEAVLAASRRVMEVAVERGRRPRSIYGANRRGCPRCGGPVSVRGQGEANRVAYWCPRCQS